MSFPKVSDEYRKEDSAFDSSFQSKTWREDVTLKVEGKELYVSKVILSLVSPVLSKMFETETDNGTNKEIELPGKSCEDVREFLLCVYPNIFKPITRLNFKQVLPLAHEFQVAELKTRCETFMLESLHKASSVKEIAVYIKLAIQCNVEVVKERCIDILSSVERGQNDIVELENIGDLDFEVIYEVLKRLNNNLRRELNSANWQLSRYKRQ